MPGKLLIWVGFCLLLVIGLAFGLDTSRLARASAPQSPGATYTVNDNADTIDADPSVLACADGNGKCTLRAAIMQANFTTTPDTITIPAGTYVLTRTGYDDQSLIGDLDIEYPLTIQGAGSGLTILNGNGGVNGDRVFHVLDSAAAVTFRGMTIRNGAVPTSGVGGPSWGGGILLSNPGVSPILLQLNDIILEGNSALTGGGLYASGGTVTLQNSVVRFNAAVSGGAGGGLYVAFGSTLTIRDSRVYSNSANTGGALALEGVLNALVERTEFYSNTATGNGGSIDNSSTFDFPQNPLTVVDSSLHDNSSGFSGGAISTFSTLALSRTVLDANHAFVKGGGVFAALGSADALASQESTFSRNTAQYGGAVEYEGTGTGLTLVNSTLSGNIVSHDGGGIYGMAGAKIWLYNATVAANGLSRGHLQFGPMRGGGVFVTDTAVVTAQNTLIADNYYTDNLSQFYRDDCFGSLHSLGHNLIETATTCIVSGTTFGNITGQDPVLGLLQPPAAAPPSANQVTPIRPLLIGSPAIDNGDSGGCHDAQGHLLLIDQRRFRRPIGARCDIGAVEYSPFALDLPLIRR